jgi:hypothetical protein
VFFVAICIFCNHKFVQQKIPENRQIEQMYPLLDNNLFPLKNVHRCADGSSVDVFGLVVFVGRLQVDLVARQSYSQWRQKECYRWIKIQDDNGEELACKIYANTQWKTLQSELVEGSIMFLKGFVCVFCCFVLTKKKKKKKKRFKS